MQTKRESDEDSAMVDTIVVCALNRKTALLFADRV